MDSKEKYVPKKINIGSLKTDTWCPVSKSECLSSKCFLNGCSMKKRNLLNNG